MAFNFSKTLVNLFGSRNERMVKAYLQVALKAGDFEEEIKSLSDEQLKAKTAQFKESINNGTSPEDLLSEAFAVVRETARRNVEMRHFDVQLVGGHVLYEGKIAEMATGEGKTLVATLAAYLVHLTGRKIHVITVNDYLAKRDAEWMEPVYNALGLTVGAIQADMDTSGQERKDQYSCDITYGTNNEFGFDYLRDNMKISIKQMAQGPLEYAIIDEVDSILIDEARTPLIISGPAFDDVTRYKKADAVCRQLLSLQSERDKLKKRIDLTQREIANAEGELSEAKKAKDKSRVEAARKVIEEKAQLLGGDEAKIETMTEYFEVEHDRKAAHLTHDGIGAAQDIAGVGSFFTGSTMDWPHLLEQGLRAHIVFEKEKEYVIMDGKIVIVDEFTGRLMQGRQWSDGLHQAVEAKEGVQVKEESQTLATITLQNFFKLYEQIAGMTGTAATEAEEFMNIYELDVVVIPTNKPCARDDKDDEIYKSIKEKFNAIVEEIFKTSSSGKPVLVGTISIEKSEAISNALNKKYGLEHEVLNAKQHQREAVIVEKAGHQYKTRDNRMFGNVTIATNMAGRGTDIKLGEGVAELGGLHIVGTERHDSRRIDNQLRGRAGRQGDAGASIFFLSFDDDLMRIFGGDKITKLLKLVGWKEGEPIYNPLISKQIANVQKKVEERNFEVRKSLLEYDEVMDYQRKIFYSRRRKLLKGIDLKETICNMIDSVLSSNCDSVLDANYPYNCIVEWSRSTFGADLDAGRINGLKPAEIEEQIKNQAKKNVANEISLSLGEYLEDYEDRSTWNIESLCKWAMSAFGASLSAGKLRHADSEEIEDILVEAATEQVDKKDCSHIDEFLKEDFALTTIAHWASSKFDVNVNISELRNLKPEQVLEHLRKLIEEKYTQREISYPVDFAMNMAFGSEGPNAYGLEALVDWVNKKYLANISSDEFGDMPPKTIHKKLIEYSKAYNNGKLTEEVNSKVGSCSKEELLQWAAERFEAKLEQANIEDDEAARENITYAAKQFLRKELADLEKYVLLQIYDGTWKDHLYAMDHLKESIFLRAFAEKDPKVEYKHEGFKMFNEMLATTDDKVAGTIFKVQIAPDTKTRNVWNVSATKHDEVNQFAMAERQRAAATAPQGDQKVKQIKLDQPKVGRNEPCPCGSGKKYKKCCGKNA
jgi:preprotein translocase subunit SecA